MAGKCYVVQSKVDTGDVRVFSQRTTLCDVMGEVEGSKWVRASLDYHFNKKKEVVFDYRGYRIVLADFYKGVPRGRQELGGFFKKGSEISSL